MAHKSEIGKTGEDLACEYLKDKKYKILERNHRQKWGELDIVAMSPDKILIFVEVKTLRYYSGQALRLDSGQAIRQYGNAANDILAVIRQLADELLPEENLTKSKLIKVKRTAQMFADQHPELIDEEKGWRIDLIAISLIDSENQINHYENI